MRQAIEVRQRRKRKNAASHETCNFDKSQVLREAINHAAVTLAYAFPNLLQISAKNSFRYKDV